MNPYKAALITGLALAGFLISFFGINLSLRTYDGSRRIIHAHEHSDQDNYCFELNSQPDSLLIRHSPSSPLQLTPQHTDHSVIKRAKFTFLSNPSLIIWVIVMSMMLGTAFGLCLPLIHRIIELYRHFNRKHRPIAKRSLRLLVFKTLLLVIILVLLNANSLVDILTAFDITRQFQIIFYSTQFANLVIYLTLSVAGIATFGLFFINVCIPNIDESKVNIKRITERFQELNHAMRFFLTSIAILIIYSIITSSLFQQVLSRSLTFEGVKDVNLFPSEFIYAYGLLFTIVLAVIYLPIDLHLRSEGRRLATRLKTSGADSKQLESIKTQSSGPANLNLFLTILSPILGSAFTELIKLIST